MKLELAASSPGDVIFVFNKATAKTTFGSNLSVFGQRVLAGLRLKHRVPFLARLPRHSHVILGLGGGVVIHADGRKVSIELLSDAMRDVASGAMSFQAFRRVDIDAEAATLISTAAVRYHNQKYSFATYFGAMAPARRAPDGGDEDTTQFCSRLVAHAYASSGHKLTELPERSVLPVDLYVRCQSAPWVDVSDLYVARAIDPTLGATRRSLDIPGFEDVSLNELLQRSDELIAEVADLGVRQYEASFDIAQRVITIEAMMAKLASARFDVAKAAMLNPSIIDAGIAHDVTRAVEQVETLLINCAAPDLETLTSAFNHGHADLNIDYAGMPSREIIREMQQGRVQVMMATFLLLSEVGLLSALASVHDSPKVARFRGVAPAFAQQFLEAAPCMADIDVLEARAGDLYWMWSDSEADVARRSIKNIAAALRAIALHKSVAARA